jgi:hypothetical protein
LSYRAKAGGRDRYTCQDNRSLAGACP